MEETILFYDTEILKFIKFYLFTLKLKHKITLKLNLLILNEIK